MALSDTEKITIVKSMIDDDVSEETITAFLTISKAKLISIVYPFGTGEETLPAKYDITQCDVAAYMINKRGAEGETSHSENGIDRSYGDADIPASLLRSVVPMCKVIGASDEQSDTQ